MLLHRNLISALCAGAAIVATSAIASAQPAQPQPEPAPEQPVGDEPDEPGDADEPADPPDGDPGDDGDAPPVDEPPEDEPPIDPRRPIAPGAGGPVSPGGVQLLPKSATAGAGAGPKKETDTKGQASAEVAKDQVYAEQWWSHARPILEMHGYFRVRAELFHNFSLGRIDRPDGALWPLPADNQYETLDESYGPVLCTAQESSVGPNDSDDQADGLYPCKNKSQAGANMRFRINPELHISDNLRIISQIDMLDNLVLGSTPEGYYIQPSRDGGYEAGKRGGYVPLGAFENTQEPPSAGRNSLTDSIRVKRAWAEYLTPVGQLRFGRMPSHWGLGILANAGDGYDDDFQSTSDRIMFVTGIKSLDLYFAGAWDFPNEGPTSETPFIPQAQAYDVAQLDDVDQYVFVVVRRKNPQLQKLALARGDLVLNGGAYVVYRKQLLANDQSGSSTAGAYVPGGARDSIANGYVRRGAEAWIPDVWLQLLYKDFRFEMEAVTIQGSIEGIGFTGGDSGDYLNPNGENGWKIRQWGVATELEQRLVENRLSLQFKFGYATGDAEALEVIPGTGGLTPGFAEGLQPQVGDRTISTFRFHPNYRVDLILNRNILTRIQGTHYFRPSIDYDFVRNGNGQRFGGGFAAIWTRATEFMQTPGHERNLAVELDFSLYFQSKDGTLNDDPAEMGGFYSMLQWGIMFPMGGLGYQPAQAQRINESFNDPGAADISTAQILRWYLGVMF